jgi:hypothetical protein
MSMYSYIHLTLLIGPTNPLPAPSFLMKAIQLVEVTNTDEGRDGFQITFAAGRSPADMEDYLLMNKPLLSPFNRVIISVSLGAVQKVLIDGIITHKQLTPSNEPGKSTLTVTGEDVSVMMDMEEKSETHPNQPDTAIVNKIILSYGQYGLAPVVISPVSMDVPLIVDRVPSQQGTDLAYLLELASSHDYVFYIEPTDRPGLNNAYWGPLGLTGSPQKALSVNMGTGSNVTSINFQYNSLKPSIMVGSVQDRNTNAKIPIATFSSLRPPLSNEPAILARRSNVRIRQFRASGVNALQAFAKAQAETDKSVDALSANGELDTVWYGDVLRARKLVGLRGAGHAHDGLYYVKSVTHRIKLGEYKQDFTITREGFGSSTKAVPP